MRNTTRNALTLLGVGFSSYFSGLFLVCHLVGCSDCTARFPDGSCASDAGPVMSTEMDGVWCEEPRADGSELCLVVHDSQYEWRGHSCTERGALSGGLEFTPTLPDSSMSRYMFRQHASPCISYDYYSASVDWTRTGLEVFLDSGTVLKLDWQD